MSIWTLRAGRFRSDSVVIHIGGSWTVFVGFVGATMVVGVGDRLSVWVYRYFSCPWHLLVCIYINTPEITWVPGLGISG